MRNKENYLQILADHIDGRDSMFQMIYLMAKIEELFTLIAHGELEIGAGQAKLMTFAEPLRQLLPQAPEQVRSHAESLLETIERLNTA